MPVCYDTVIRQTLTSYDFPITFQDWKDDCVLQKPVLTSPVEGENVCPPVSADPEVDGSGIILQWDAVPDADFYVVQWAKTSEFNGPTLRGMKVTAPTIEYEMEVPDDISLGDEVSYRVQAFSDNGCVSTKSEPVTFKYACNQGGGSGGRDKLQLCKFFSVKNKIDGKKDVDCNSTPSYNADYTYNKADASGDVQIKFLNIKWALKGGENSAIVKQHRDQVNLNVDENKPTNLELKCTLRFQFIEGGVGTFVCEEKFKIRVDCPVVDGDDDPDPIPTITSFWAEITGSPSGDSYPINPLNDCLTDDSANSVSSAEEVNGHTDIPVGTIVRVWVSTSATGGGAAGCAYFEHCVCGSSSHAHSGAGGF